MERNILKANAREIVNSDTPVMKKTGFPADRPCSAEEWLFLLTLIVLSPGRAVKTIRIEKKIGGHSVS